MNRNWKVGYGGKALLQGARLLQKGAIQIMTSRRHGNWDCTVKEKDKIYQVHVDGDEHVICSCGKEHCAQGAAVLYALLDHMDETDRLLPGRLLLEAIERMSDEEKTALLFCGAMEEESVYEAVEAISKNQK